MTETKHPSIAHEQTSTNNKIQIVVVMAFMVIVLNCDITTRATYLKYQNSWFIAESTATVK